MKELILLLAGIVNRIHDVMIIISQQLGFQLTDKALHFWIIGILGIGIFFIVYLTFKMIAKLKWSTTIFSFVYTFTIMVVFVFAIEIQQAITNRGNMEFADAVIGLWGFLFLFFLYVVLMGVGYLITAIYKSKSKPIKEETDRQEIQPKSRSDYHKK